jgi:hypothetical protein
MTIDITEAIVALCLWPCLSYTVGSTVPFLARRWARWLRVIPAPVLGAVANVVGACLSLLAVWAA